MSDISLPVKTATAKATPSGPLVARHSSSAKSNFRSQFPNMLEHMKKQATKKIAEAEKGNVGDDEAKIMPKELKEDVSEEKSFSLLKIEVQPDQKLSELDERHGPIDTPNAAVDGNQISNLLVKVSVGANDGSALRKPAETDPDSIHFLKEIRSDHHVQSIEKPTSCRDPDSKLETFRPDSISGQRKDVKNSEIAMDNTASILNVTKEKVSVSVIKVETHFNFDSQISSAVSSKIIESLSNSSETAVPIVSNVILEQQPVQVKTLHILLQPENLGDLKVVMSLHGKILSLKIEASSKETAAILTKNHQILKELVIKAGYEIADASISISQRSESQSFNPTQNVEHQFVEHMSEQSQGRFSDTDFGGRNESRQNERQNTSGGDFASERSTIPSQKIGEGNSLPVHLGVYL
jgi:flagellar hook-length control protein FliK